jgi:hypothetical protein
MPTTTALTQTNIPGRDGYERPQVSGLLTAGGVVVAVGDLELLVACWKRRSVLGCLLAAEGLPLAAFAISTESGSPAGRHASAIAVIALVIGTALDEIGPALELLLTRTQGCA